MNKVFAVVMAMLVVVGTLVVIVVVGDDDPVGAYDDPYPIGFLHGYPVDVAVIQ